MKHLTLTFNHRISVMNFLGGCTGEDGIPILAALWRISEAVRLTDEEDKALVKKDIGQGARALEPPAIEGWGGKTIAIEDYDGKIFIEQLEKGKGRLHVSDMPWVDRFKTELLMDVTRKDAGQRKK